MPELEYELFDKIFNRNEERFVIDCGKAKGIVENYYRMDEETGEEYNICFLEVNGEKLFETECYAKTVKDGLETVVAMIIELQRDISVNLSKAQERYKLSKE